MTEKLKKQSFNSPQLSVGILLLALILLFVLTCIINQSYLYILSIGLIIIVLFLIPKRIYLVKKEAESELRIQGIEEQRNLVEAEIERQEKIISSFQEKIVNYSELKGLTEQLAACLTLEDTSKTLSSEVNKLFGDKETTIILYLFHSKTGELGITSSQKGQLRINLKSKRGDDFDHWVVKSMQPLLIEDTKSDYRFDMDNVAEDDARSVRSLISVPMAIGNKAIGILRIDSPKEGCFITEDLRLLTAVGDLGAVAIENAQLYERVEQLAIKDSLTGLFLRKYVMDRIPEEISRHLRRKKEFSVLMIDIDKFKQYNDKFGHMAGDIVLRALGILILEIFNEPGNLLCRYGGEEFLVLLAETSKKQAQELAEKFRARVQDQDILLRREKTNITVSIGIATYPKDANNFKELIHIADLALYEAKNNGRNRVCTAR